MKKSSLLLILTLAIPTLAISQTPENPTPAPAPDEEKPVLPSDPVAVPEVPPVHVPTPVSPAPAPVEDAEKHEETAPAPPKSDPHNEEKGNGKGKDKGQSKGKPKDKDKDKDDPKKHAPSERRPSPPSPEAEPTPPAETKTPPQPAEDMKRPTRRPAEGEADATPPAAPADPAATPDPQRGPGDGVPRTRPVPSPSMPAQPPGTPASNATPPTVRTADPRDGEPRGRPERPVVQAPPSKETAKVLEDQGRRDRNADAQQAERIEGTDDAKRLILNILGAAVGAGAIDRSNQARPGPGDRSRHGYRPSVEEVGRTQQDRQRNIGSMVNRFEGRTPQTPPPGNAYRGDPQFYEGNPPQRYTQFYEGNRRVVRYSSMREIPPVIVASQRLNRVQVTPLSQSVYTARPQGFQEGHYYNEAPPSYTANDAYAVSYGVDPESAISRDDILFRQGSTDFADAYSYDLVIDVAEALNAPSLLNETFVIEGHASAEGDYGKNLLLSQERAERISRELVRNGVSPERLMPVGYGETEAAHPASAPESERRLDRRVMVFRMR